MFSSILTLLFFVAPSGQFLNQIDGFLEPSHAIWLPNGNIAVADRLADEIIILSPDGERISVVHAEGVEAIKWSEDGLVRPIDAFASLPWETNEIRRQGIPSSTPKEWLVPDLLGHSIHHYDQEGNWIGKWGVHALLPHEGEGKIHYPNAVDVSPDGKQVIVCEGFEGRIQIFALGDGEPEPFNMVGPGRCCVRQPAGKLCDAGYCHEHRVCVPRLWRAAGDLRVGIVVGCHRQMR